MSRRRYSERMSPEPEAAGSSKQAGTQPPACCPLYHEAVELIGRRWTGAIVAVLLDHGPMRFSEIAQAVPELSDRLLSERMKELESRGVVVAPRRARPAGQGDLRADGHGQRAAAGAGRAEVVGAPLAGLRTKSAAAGAPAPHARSARYPLDCQSGTTPGSTRRPSRIAHACRCTSADACGPKATMHVEVRGRRR